MTPLSALSEGEANAEAGDILPHRVDRTYLEWKEILYRLRIRGLYLRSSNEGWHVRAYRGYVQPFRGTVREVVEEPRHVHMELAMFDHEETLASEIAERLRRPEPSPVKSLVDLILHEALDRERDLIASLLTSKRARLLVLARKSTKQGKP